MWMDVHCKLIDIVSVTKYCNYHTDPFFHHVSNMDKKPDFCFSAFLFHLSLWLVLSTCLRRLRCVNFRGCLQFRQAKTEIVSASKVAYRFLLGVTSNVAASTESSGNSNRGSPRFQGTWFKSLITSGAKPSSSSELENQEEVVLRQHQQSDAASPVRQTSQPWRDI